MQNSDDSKESPKTISGAETAAKNELLIQLGKNLCAARLAAGLSVKQISETTRINSSFIESIEQGDLSQLPGLAFGRGFIDCICKELKIEPKSFLNLYDDYIKSNQLNDFKTLDPCNSNHIRQSSDEKKTLKNLNQFWSPSEKNRGLLKNGGNYVTYSLYFAAILGLFLITFSYFKKNKPVTPNSVVSESTNSMAPIPANEIETFTVSDIADTQTEDLAPVDSNGVNSRVEPLAQNTGKIPAPENAPISPTKPQVGEQKTSPSDSAEDENPAPTAQAKTTASKNTIYIKVLEPSDIRQRCDGGGYQTKRWEQSGEISFNAACEITLFDAAAVELTFNGAPLGNLGNKNIRRNLSFSNQPVKSAATQKL